MSSHPLIDQWKVWQFSQSHSPRTITARTSTVLRCAGASDTPPHQLTSIQLIEWLSADHWSATTRWTYHQHLSSWHYWLQKLGHRIDNPMDATGKPRRPKGLPHPISDEHYPLILQQAKTTEHLAMLLLAGLQGFRTSEIAQVKGEEVDLIGNQITVLGKGSKRAVLPLHPMVAKVALSMPRDGYWFPSRSGRGHFNRISVGDAIGRMMRRAGAPGTAHSLRHWFATTLVDNGVDLTTVQQLLRHENLSSTQIYVQVSEERRVSAVFALDPYRSRDTGTTNTEDRPVTSQCRNPRDRVA